jgi:hypothetical protein
VTVMPGAGVVRTELFNSRVVTSKKEAAKIANSKKFEAVLI